MPLVVSPDRVRETHVRVHPEFLANLADPKIITGTDAITADLRKQLRTSAPAPMTLAAVRQSVAKELEEYVRCIPTVPAATRIVSYPLALDRTASLRTFVKSASAGSPVLVARNEALGALAPQEIIDRYAHTPVIRSGPTDQSIVQQLLAAINAIAHGSWTFTKYGSIEDIIAPQGCVAVAAACSLIASGAATKFVTAVTGGAPWWVILIWGLVVAQAAWIGAVTAKAARDNHKAALGWNAFCGLFYAYEK